MVIRFFPGELLNDYAQIQSKPAKKSKLDVHGNQYGL
jgi:hypothetical protein